LCQLRGRSHVPLAPAESFYAVSAAAISSKART
jgi:hypothetical protein